MVDLRAFQETARQRYASLPWPIRTDEEWRRTDPGLISLSETALTSQEAGFQVGLDGPTPEQIQRGVILTDLKSALRQFPDLVGQYLYQAGNPQGLVKFVTLHQAFSSQGVFCYVPDGVRVEQPFRVWIESGPSGAAFFPHVVLVAGAHSEVTLLEERRSSSDGTAPIICDEMTEIFLGPGAIARHVRLQRWGPSVTELFTQRALLGQDAQFMNLDVGLGGRLTKACVETILTGTGARAELSGILFGANHQHFDFHTLQDHQARSTMSDLLYKNILTGSAKSVYTGLIRISKEAQKSDAFQANRNLLLSAEAKADSVPMLEIEADDVRCTHGVAVGPVDEDQAFYLMSRGLTPEEAEHLIVEGFIEPVLSRIPIESLKEEVRTQIQRKMAAHG